MVRISTGVKYERVLMERKAKFILDGRELTKETH